MPFSSLYLFADDLSRAPTEDFHLGAFVVTNSMVVSGLAALLIIGLVQWAMARPQAVPSGLQNFVEWVVESLSAFLESIVGKNMIDRSFWFFATIFIFIFTCNMISLFPGVGTFGYGHPSEGGFEVTRPFFRGANADANMTAAMAVVWFVLWLYWCLQVLGPVGFLGHIFGSKAKFPYLLANLAFSLIFLFVGVIEVVSILFRPLTFTFRLYGNIYGGEYLLDTVYKIAPHYAWAMLVPFYFLELLVAFIQAFVFCVLSAVFTGIMCKHDETGNSEVTAH